MNIGVHIDAAATGQGIAQKKSHRPNPRANAVLLMWRTLVKSAIHDAKQTLEGMPTDVAILARWWICEHKPKQADTEEWERSFECACGWLELDVNIERKRLVEEIDASLQEAYLTHMRSALYRRRAAVLSCAGISTSIGRQFVLPLVSKKDYEDVAGVDHGDRFIMYDRLDSSTV